MGSSTHNCYYNTLYRHFQVSIIKNDTYFFWVKAKNIYIIFLVLLKRKSVLFFSNRSLWINPPKIFFKHFFQRKKTWKKGVWISTYDACYPTLSSSCLFPFFSKDTLWQMLRNGKQRILSVLLKLSLWDRKITNYLKD